MSKFNERKKFNKIYNFMDYEKQLIKLNKTTKPNNIFEYIEQHANKENDLENEDKTKQGRSFQTRLRIANEDRTHHMVTRSMKDQMVECPHCFCNNILYSKENYFCENCGKTLDILMDQQVRIDKLFIRAMMRVPYKPDVHFRTKINMASGKGPHVALKYVSLIEKHLMDHPEIAGKNIYYAGSQSIKRSIIDLNNQGMTIEKRYKECWVQIRSLFLIEGIQNDKFTCDNNMLDRLIKRYNCVVQAFKRIYANKRKNNLILHYTITQLLRIESEDMFKEFACFFPIYETKKQPYSYNEIWKKIIEYCEKNFTIVHFGEHDQVYVFDWRYQPLTKQDLMSYFFRLH